MTAFVMPWIPYGAACYPVRWQDHGVIELNKLTGIFVFFIPAFVNFCASRARAKLQRAVAIEKTYLQSGKERKMSILQYNEKPLVENASTAPELFW